MLVTFAGSNQTPRQRLGSVGYAYMAGSLPPGTEVAGEVTSGTKAAIKGSNSATLGVVYGIHGVTNSLSGRGVYGSATFSTGLTFGVFGESASDAGRGVYGLVSSTTGTTCGVYGQSYSSSGYGVYGLCSLPTGYGIYGENDGGGLAGGFEGDVDVNGRLKLPNYDATPTQGSGSLEIGNALRIDGNEIITNTDGLLHLQRDNNGDLKVDEGTLMVDASLNRVGIGTPTPQEALSVMGRVYVSNMDGTSSGYTVRWYDNRLYYLVSSEKYKTSIQILDDDFDAILEAVPKSFTDKSSGEQCIGFIAEELHHLGLENLVQYRDGEPEAVKHEMISLYLLQVIKDLKQENEEFAARIALLEEPS